MTRYPDGVDGKAFFEKQSPPHRPDWVRTVAVPSDARRTIDYTLVEDLPTLVWLANLAALELHAPLHRAPALERPTAVVFDLDPGPPATIVECCRVALWLRGRVRAARPAELPEDVGLEGPAGLRAARAGAVGYEQTKAVRAQPSPSLVEQRRPELAVSRMTQVAARRARC